MSAARALECCPNCRRHTWSLVAGCSVCAVGHEDDDRPCGCRGNAECPACEELGECPCGAEAIPVRVLSDQEGLCGRCWGRHCAYEAHVDDQIDALRERRMGGDA